MFLVLGISLGVVPQDMLSYIWIRDDDERLGPEVEAKEAAVGEEVVVERQEDGVPGRQRPRHLRQRRAPARRRAPAQHLREQPGRELPRRTQLGQPSGALGDEVAGGNASRGLGPAPPLLLEGRIGAASAITT